MAGQRDPPPDPPEPGPLESSGEPFYLPQQHPPGRRSTVYCKSYGRPIVLSNCGTDDRARRTQSRIKSVPCGTCAMSPVEEDMLIGRSEELAVLAAAVDQSRQGLSATLVLRGEAGIGKTTLLDAAVRSASENSVIRIEG